MLLAIHSGTYRSTCWFPFEELDVVTAMGRVKSGVEEHTTLCYGFQGPWTLVRETKTHKNLETIETFIKVCLLANRATIGLMTILFVVEFC